MTEAKKAPEKTESPVITSRSTRQVITESGPEVKMRVTVNGHAQVSAGTDFGFDRYPMGAEFTCAESTARHLTVKGYAEPVGSQDEVMKITRAWKKQAAEDDQREARRKRAFDNMLENGVNGAGNVVSDADIWEAR